MSAARPATRRPDPEIDALRAKIGALEAENAALRAANLRLEAALAPLHEKLDALAVDVRRLRSDLRRPGAAPALVAALEEYFGPGTFTARGLLEICDSHPHGEIAEAIADLIDMNASSRSRATALGARLARIGEIEAAGTQHHTTIYRLRKGDVGRDGP
jgi:hypothetical protein